MSTAKLTIYEAIPRIMADVEPIAKERKNQQQGFMFRGIDDVYAALQAVMAKHGVFTVPNVVKEHTEERQSKSGTSLIYRVLTIEYTLFASDGTSVKAVVIGEGMDSGDKASNKAMSIAHKYALLQVFAIPTADPKDPDADRPEGKDGLEPKADESKADKREMQKSSSPAKLKSRGGQQLAFSQADLDNLYMAAVRQSGDGVLYRYDLHKRLFGMVCQLFDLMDPNLMRAASAAIEAKGHELRTLDDAVAEWLEARAKASAAAPQPSVGMDDIPL